jgi:hypothetical protein
MLPPASAAEEAPLPEPRSAIAPCEDGSDPPCSDCLADEDCASGEGCCSGLCTDTDTDFLNCGLCTSICNVHVGVPACIDGVCVGVECAVGPTGATSEYDCDWRPSGCETQRSESDCGGCGIACGSGEVCDEEGSCVCGDTAGSPGDGPACEGDTICAGLTCVDPRCLESSP